MLKYFGVREHTSCILKSFSPILVEGRSQEPARDGMTNRRHWRDWIMQGSHMPAWILSSEGSRRYWGSCLTSLLSFVSSWKDVGKNTSSLQLVKLLYVPGTVSSTWSILTTTFDKGEDSHGEQRHLLTITQITKTATFRHVQSTSAPVRLKWNLSSANLVPVLPGDTQ